MGVLFYHMGSKYPSTFSKNRKLSEEGNQQTSPSNGKLNRPILKEDRQGKLKYSLRCLKIGLGRLPKHFLIGSTKLKF